MKLIIAEGRNLSDRGKIYRFIFNCIDKIIPFSKISEIEIVSGQASDKTMRVRIRTANNKDCKFLSVGLLWD